MKKMMIGILILIPIIILLVVAAVSRIVSMTTFIAVDNFEMSLKDGSESVQLELDGSIINMTDLVNISIYPERATNKTITWSIENLRCLDVDYEKRYQEYLDYIKNNPDGTAIARVRPAAMMVDYNSNEVTTNNTGRFIANTYCTFYIKAEVGAHSRRVFVAVTGFDVENILLNAAANDMTVGDNMLISPVYTPVDSIINEATWTSDNPSVAVVDSNGTVTAVSAGTANITLQARVYSSFASGQTPVYVTSVPYTITVSNGMSTVHGNSLTTHLSSFTLEEIGLGAYINDDSLVLEGCSIVNNIVTLTGNTATISKGNNQFVINRCESEDIRIVNADIYAYDINRAEGYVLEVSERGFVLSAVWSSMMKSAALDGVEWTSSNTDIATVSQDGVVLAKSSGLVTITATKGGRVAAIVINVQTKITSLSLKTSNESLKIGIAEETVFAAEKYVDAKVSGAKTPNSVLIELQYPIAPVGNAAAMAVYLSSFNFKVAEGEDYAYFSNETPNLLVFNPTALEGKGKTTIRVEVSAKYPKYESLTQYTTDYVDITVIYGVEVSNVAELRRATKEQKDYATAEGNAIVKYEYETTYGEYKSIPEGYSGSSRQLFAICFNGDIAFDANESVSGDNKIAFYGSVYGNNHMLMSSKGHLAETDPLARICWSDVTISNLKVRTMAMDESFENDGSINGYVFSVHSEIDSYRFRHNNIVIEYCVLENSRCGLKIYNTDVTVNGCIFRNMAQTGMFVPTQINGSEGQYATYANVVINDLVVSNVIGTIMSAAYEHYSVDNNTNKQRVGWKENFYDNGMNTTVRQTGFIDLYNWQSLDELNMLKDSIGNPQIGAILDSALGSFIKGETYFNTFRAQKLTEPGKDYFHLGFISTEISGKGEKDGGKSWLDITFEDPRIRRVHTRSADFPDNGLGSILKGFDVSLCGYLNYADITPDSICDESAAINKIKAHK